MVEIYLENVWDLLANEAASERYRGRGLEIRHNTGSGKGQGQADSNPIPGVTSVRGPVSTIILTFTRGLG
jgi:hypothetical protein